MFCYTCLISTVFRWMKMNIILQNYVEPLMHYYVFAHREGGNKRCFCPFVRPSVCLSVAYMANNAITQRPSVPKLGRKVPHLRCDSQTSFKVKMLKVRVTRPINADTHRAPWSSEIYATNFKLGIRMEEWRTTTTRISHRRHDLQGQRSRSQSHVINLSRVGPMAHKSINQSNIICNTPCVA